MNKQAMKISCGIVLMLVAGMAQALQTSSFGTTFSADESLWQGAGIPATGFDKSFSTGGSIGISGRAFADTGTASATVAGSFAATYDEIIGSDDSLNVKLNYTGASSNISSAFGALASLDAFVDVSGCLGIPTPLGCGGVNINVDTSFELAGIGASLEPGRSFNANLGSNSGNASDQQEVTSVGGYDIPVAGRIGASLDGDFKQTISLTPESLNGILAGVNRDSGATVSRAFNIGSSDMTSLSIAGLGNGIWDFSILDLDLLGRFYNSGALVIEPTINYLLGSWSITSFNIPLISNNFLMDFDTINARNLFSVLVTPIPAAVWLFGTALIGFIGFARRRNIS